MSNVPRRLSAIDLNLLVAFEALWAERSVTRAGRAVGLSQPAMSSALARLRAMLQDPLFVRGRSQLLPTERCAALAAPLAKALADIRAALAGVPFEPATSERQLTVGAVDAALAVVIPRVAGRFALEAPHAQLVIRAIDPTQATDLVEAGTVDVALTPRVRPSSMLKQRTLFPLELRVALRPDHPLARRKLTRQDLARYPRLRVTFDPASAPRKRLEPRGGISVGSFLAVPHVLAECDAWALIPAPFAKQLAKRGAVAVSPIPPQMPSPRFALHMVWLLTQDTSAASRWLRSLIVDAAAAVVGDGKAG
jgi:DNA-binding transcriptional LysR family regulator